MAKADEVHPSAYQDLEGDVERANSHPNKGPDALDPQPTANGISTAVPPPPQKNAFTTLMSSRPTAPKPSPPKKPPSAFVKGSFSGPFIGRYGLGVYLQPSYSDPRIISKDAHWVLLWDMFPKSKLHILLLPAQKPYCETYVLDAFDDDAFRGACIAKVTETKRLVAKELARMFGKYSALDRRRAEAIDAARDEQEEANAPAGRDWEAEIKTGVHVLPSMNHLHIHFLSVDRVSDKLNKRGHYNSFNTEFLIPVTEFPLGKKDRRRSAGKMHDLLMGEMRCWRCRKVFWGFGELKKHLEVEFKEWVKI